MKVFAVSGDKNWYKIGLSFQNAKWVGRTQATASILDTVVKGDEVEFTSTKDASGKDMFATVSKTGTATKKEEPQQKSTSTYTGKKRDDNSQFRTPDEITKQEIGQMVSRTMLVFSGTLDVNNLDVIETTIKRLFTIYEEQTRV